ncbi:hypothetical protein [Kineobactrum salinum]|uniref:Terminase small subunit n=1 Tax=Kineobactrum salinum TaxID=2708301 RepID=A0A6C0U812_9GAMM|nr:hypothetical protein [Kineobactrum salinum]QIB67157.1 hypothetical protein G3T16_18870 [Kineobactrum salinum]
MNIEALTVQEETFFLNHIRGVSLSASAKAAGMSPTRGKELLGRPGMDKLREYFRNQMIQGIRFDIDVATSMYLEAHRKAFNATEEIKATDSLAKLHMLGGFAPVQVIVREQETKEAEGRDITPPKTTKALERMDEVALMRLADMDGLNSLDPVADDDDTGSGTQDGDEPSAEPQWELVDD